MITEYLKIGEKWPGRVCFTDGRSGQARIWKDTFNRAFVEDALRLAGKHSALSLTVTAIEQRLMQLCELLTAHPPKPNEGPYSRVAQIERDMFELIAHVWKSLLDLETSPETRLQVYEQLEHVARVRGGKTSDSPGVPTAPEHDPATSKRLSRDEEALIRRHGLNPAAVSAEKFNAALKLALEVAAHGKGGN
jgi:hypothetical protein